MEYNTQDKLRYRSEHQINRRQEVWNVVKIRTGWSHETQDIIRRQYVQILHLIMGKICQGNAIQDWIKIGIRQFNIKQYNSVNASDQGTLIELYLSLSPVTVTR